VKQRIPGNSAVASNEKEGKKEALNLTRIGREVKREKKGNEKKKGSPIGLRVEKRKNMSARRGRDENACSAVKKKQGKSWKKKRQSLGHLHRKKGEKATPGEK